MQFEKIMNHGLLYDSFQRIIRGKKEFDSIKDFFFTPQSAMNSEKNIKVLDIACGPGTYVSYLINTDYTGIDINEENILLAKKKYENFPNIKFVAEDVSKYFLNNMKLENTFDFMFMPGLLHHIPKETIDSILPLVPKFLKENGELRVSDPVYTEKLPKISKWVMAHDRGKYILELDDYLALIRNYFPAIKYKVATYALRLPFPFPAITWTFVNSHI